MAPRLLDKIDEPGDLRGLTHEELAQIAQEARDTIISVITERGGHLASNLGVVELTLALHRVFDSPKDRIVWDTTNQLYTHKLVTGTARRVQGHPSRGRTVRLSESRARVCTTRSRRDTPAPDCPSLSASPRAQPTRSWTPGPSPSLATGL